jgi:hypothetical protein
MLTYFILAPIDSTVASGTQYKTGQASSMSFTTSGAGLVTTGNSAAPGTDVHAHATISELGTTGVYQVAYDPELYGAAAGVLDCGAGFSAGKDRYLAVAFERDSSRLQSAVNAAGKVVEVALVDAAPDPWATTLPGSYTTGQAGQIVGSKLDATVSSRTSGSPPAYWSSLVINPATGGVKTDGSRTVTLRDNRGVTAPTEDDCLAAAHCLAAAFEQRAGTVLTLNTASGGVFMVSDLDSGTNPATRTPRSS